MGSLGLENARESASVVRTTLRSSDRSKTNRLRLLPDTEDEEVDEDEAQPCRRSAGEPESASDTPFFEPETEDTFWPIASEEVELINEAVEVDEEVVEEEVAR